MTRRTAAVTWWVVCVLAVGAGPSDAQAPPEGGGPGRFEVAVAGTVSASLDLGGGAASLTPNLNGSPYTLFTATASYTTPAGGDMRVSFRVAPWLLVGASGSLARGDVTVRTAADAESTTQPTIKGEALGQGLLEGRVDVLATRLRVWRGRLTPYATISGGLLRQWHEGNVLIESGSVIQAGGGVRVGLTDRPKGWLSRVGASIEVRMTRASGGFHWGREHRTVPSARLECFTGWGR